MGSKTIKVDWVIIAKANGIPETWRREGGWKILKDFVRDNLATDGQPGKVDFKDSVAYIGMVHPEDACRIFNALVGVWWDGWQLSVALLEHHNGTFAKVLIPPCNTRSGPRVSINHDYKGTRDAVTATSRRTEVSFGVRPKPIYFWNTKPLSPNGARERCVWAELCRDDSYYTGFAAAKQGLPPELTLPASLAKFTPPHSWPGTPSSVSDASSWSSTTSPTNYSTSPDGDYSQPRLARSPMSKTTRTTKEGPIIARSS